MIELADDNLEQLLKDNKNVVVQYGASWCGNCRIVKPKFKKLAEQYTDVTFVYVDAEKMPNSRKLANVSNLPTFASFKDGVLVGEAQGNKIEIVEGLVNEITRH